jgi:hypothetical protein
MRTSLALAMTAVLAAIGCKKDEPSPPTTSSASAPPLPASSAPASAAAVVAESLPRCRADGARVAIPGDEVVTGDAAVASDALLVGVVRREGNKRVASIVRTSLDLASVKVIDVGAALGDDPPPSPRMRGATALVASFARAKVGAGADAGAGGSAGAGAGATRVLEIARIEAAGLVAEGSVVQQADESLAYDVAWASDDKGVPLVAWDEDAPPKLGALTADRGVVKVQLLGPGAKARVASPETSDAEAPRLLPRKGGWWLAWLARRPEAGEDAGANGAAEGPGERRAYRWVELVALDAKGEVASPVRRVSPEKGRVASFDLAAAKSGGADAQLVIVVQDEAAHAEGAGERIVRYAIDGEKIEAADLLDGGVGHALAELLPQAGDAGAVRWLVFTDTHEHAHLVPLGPQLRLAGAATTEPSLDGARVVATAAPDVVYAVGSAGATDAAGGRLELRRLVCR